MLLFSVVEGTEDNSSDEDAEEVREVTKLLSGGIMETQFGDLNVFANANRDTPTPPMTGMNILLEFYLMEVRNQYHIWHFLAKLWLFRAAI